MRSDYFFGFIFLFLVQQINAQVKDINAQVQGYYSYEVDKNRMICFNIYPNNLYCLFRSNVSDDGDQWALAHISYGTWYIKDGKIVLKDYEHNFQTVCTYVDICLFGNNIRNNIEITIEESFIWLQGIKFTKDFEIDNNYFSDFKDFPFDSKFDKYLAQKERKKHYSEKKNLFPICFGEYYYGIMYQLLIQPDHSYTLNFRTDYMERGVLKFKDIPYSEGTWQRKGNVLVLYDKSVKCSFYLIITKDGLIPNQMMYSIHLYPQPFRYKSK